MISGAAETLAASNNKFGKRTSGFPSYLLASLRPATLTTVITFREGKKSLGGGEKTLQSQSK